MELRHFDIHRDTRIVCDASRNGLSAVLEQLISDEWRPIPFASRYLNDAEKKYSTNELEMLAVVWGAKYFRSYMLGRKFLIVTDHKALVSLLNGNNKKNKTMFSRLTRWLDRLIPFDFEVEHKPVAKIGLADYLSRHPILDAKPVSTYDSLFTVAKNILSRSALGFKKQHFSKYTTGTYQNTARNKMKRSGIMNNEDNSGSDEDDYLPLVAKRTISQAATQTTTRMNVTEPHGSNSGASIELGREATSGGGTANRNDDNPTEQLRDGNGLHPCSRGGDRNKPAKQKQCGGKLKGDGARRCSTWGNIGYSTGRKQETGEKATACLIFQPRIGEFTG